jgi:hypothetical protein
LAEAIFLVVRPYELGLHDKGIIEATTLLSPCQAEAILLVSENEVERVGYRIDE